MSAMGDIPRRAVIPAIERVIAEAIASGCTEVMVVVNSRKRVIEEYLTSYCPGLGDMCCLSFMLNIGEPVHGVHIEGSRYDISTPDSYMVAWRRFGKESPKWKCL